MLTALLLLLERLGSEKVAGTGTGGCEHWDCRGQTVKHEWGQGGLVARQSWRLQRSDRFTGHRQCSKACCWGVKQALRVSKACKEILISLFACGQTACDVLSM